MTMRVGEITVGGVDIQFTSINSLAMVKADKVFGTFVDSLGSGLFLFRGGTDDNGW